MPGSNRAVFLDRDGTIVHDPGYICRPDQLSLIDGAADAIVRLRQAGFLVILATNQSAIARGMMTEDDLAAVHAKLAELLTAANPGAKLDAIYYCPFHPEAKVAAYKQESYLRKPRPGMLFKAAREHQLDLGSCWMVGDSERDVQAGKTAGCRAIRVASDPETDTMADKVLPSLAESADLILASPGRTPLRATRHAEPAGDATIAPPLPDGQGRVEAAAAPAVVEPLADPPAGPEPDAEPEDRVAATPKESASDPAGTVEVDSQGELVSETIAIAQTDSAKTQAASEQPAIEAQSAEPEQEAAQPAPPLPDKPNLGRTKERLLRQIEEDRKRAAASPGEPVDPLTADTSARPLNAGNLRHVLAEILQQVRQLNRGPTKAERSASKMLGGLFQAGSWGLVAAAAISMLNEGPGLGSLTWAAMAIFMQLASLFFFSMFKTE